MIIFLFYLYTWFKYTELWDLWKNNKINNCNKKKLKLLCKCVTWSRVSSENQFFFFSLKYTTRSSPLNRARAHVLVDGQYNSRARWSLIGRGIGLVAVADLSRGAEPVFRVADRLMSAPRPCVCVCWHVIAADLVVCWRKISSVYEEVAWQKKPRVSRVSKDRSVRGTRQKVRNQFLGKSKDMDG